MSVDFLSKNFPPFQVHHAKKPPRFYPDGFQRNVIDFYFIFSDCRLRKALYLQFSYFIWPLCTLTALVILTTGANLQSGLEGVNITIYAFESVLGKWGSYIVSIGIVMFAFSTILGWSVYGSRAAEYIGGKKLTAVYKIIFLAMTFIGAVSSIQLVWDLSDTFNGLMALPNLIGLLLLSGTVFKITKNYEQRVIGGKKIKPMLSFYDREK